MRQFKIKFCLISDATFGRGDGMASLIDSEVQHDEYGLPFMAGRTLKGLIEEECANIIFALEKQGNDRSFKDAAKHLFGNPGSKDSDKSLIHIGNARLPEDLRRAIDIEMSGKFLFTWDKIPGEDNEKLLKYLQQNYNIGWLKTATVEKIDNTIRIFTEKKSLSVRLNDKKSKLVLTIADEQIDEFDVRQENEKLNVYAIGKLEREEILNALTNIRYQTAMDESSGAPKRKSLRSMRVILRKTSFEADLSFTREPSGLDIPLLAACIKSFRRAGTGRNRGKGALTAKLYDETGRDITDTQFNIFRGEVMK